MTDSERKRLENELNHALGSACESAREEVPGFQWVTHIVDFSDVRSSIQVIWVFDSNQSLARALRDGYESYLTHLASEALSEAGVAVSDIRQHVDFDSEEECARVHGGDWKVRLTAEPEHFH